MEMENGLMMYLYLNGKEVGLFPVFNVRGPHGRFPMNHQEYIVKELGDKNETFGI